MRSKARGGGEKEESDQHQCVARSLALALCLSLLQAKRRASVCMQGNPSSAQGGWLPTCSLPHPSICVLVLVYSYFLLYLALHLAAGDNSALKGSASLLLGECPEKLHTHRHGSLKSFVHILLARRQRSNSRASISTESSLRTRRAPAQSNDEQQQSLTCSA